MMGLSTSKSSKSSDPSTSSKSSKSTYASRQEQRDTSTSSGTGVKSAYIAFALDNEHMCLEVE